MSERSGQYEKKEIGALRRWSWIWGVCVTILLILIVVIVAPGSIALYELYWGRESIQRLFYEDLGLTYAWSSFIAVASSFFYALAWVPLAAWTLRVLTWRYNYQQLFMAFACWILIYGHVPLLHALLGTDTCFNQRTGASMKWYVESVDGVIALYDSAGYDSLTRAEKKPVTPEVCAAFARQRAHSIPPRKISANALDIQFFNAATGRAQVWYSKSPENEYELFDSRGFNPVTSQPLLPVTTEIVSELLARAAKEADERKRTVAAAIKKKSENEPPIDTMKRQEPTQQIVSAQISNRLTPSSNSDSKVYSYVANTLPPDAFLALKLYPKFDSPRVMAMANGTKLDVLLRRTDGWWYVRVFPTNEQGWAYHGKNNKAYILCCTTTQGMIAAKSDQSQTAAFTELNCDQLWFVRNSVFREAGYCFKAPRAIARFGNTGCQFNNINDVQLTPENQNFIKAVQSAEEVKACPR